MTTIFRNLLCELQLVYFIYSKLLNMKIGIDIDDVLLDFLDPLNNYYNQKYRTSHKFGDYKVYNLGHTWKRDQDFTIAEIFSFYESEDFLNLNPRKDSQESIDKLFNKGFELFAITSRPTSIQNITEQSISKHFGNKFKDIILTNSFGRNGVRIEKYKVCNNLGIDIMIDDCIEYAEECANNNVEKVYLMPMPFNFEFSNRKIIRAEWQDILKDLNI